jgi:hypothetical protein
MSRELGFLAWEDANPNPETIQKRAVASALSSTWGEKSPFQNRGHRTQSAAQLGLMAISRQQHIVIWESAG